MAASVDALLLRVVVSLGALADTAAPVDDEWQYVADLVTVWGAALRAAAGARAGQEAPPGAGAAIDRLVAEAASIVDPHRAIDWLSTLPQVALLAAGEGPR
ncbi:MAG: hypothetical protein HYX55_07165 [Chloroflexi bacterium]|nr:hypothetical protein [Chloroflexota bacterium]